MPVGIPDRLLTDRVTIRKPVQSMAVGTKRPVFEYQAIATGVHARFDPAPTSLNRNVLGHTPKRGLVVFMNPTDIQENYEIIDEATGQEFVVTEVRDYRQHLEVQTQERQTA